MGSVVCLYPWEWQLKLSPSSNRVAYEEGIYNIPEYDKIIKMPIYTGSTMTFAPFPSYIYVLFLSNMSHILQHSSRPKLDPPLLVLWGHRSNFVSLEDVKSKQGKTWEVEENT